MEIEMLHQFSRNELVIGTEGLEILKSIILNSKIVNINRYI